MSHISIQENVPLAPLATLGIGGPARYFALVKTTDELREAVAFAKEQSLPIFMLGGGSNIVIADNGFAGLVIHNAIQGFESEIVGDRAKVIVGAGEPWDATVERCVDEGFAGLEALSGIPGTVGGAPVQNIGAYGQSVENSIESVEVFDCETMEIKSIPQNECEFSYRNSIFKKHPGHYCILRVIFSLTPDGAPNISSYPDIAKYFAERTGIPSLAEVRNATIEIRARKGMVISNEYESYASVGSFFQNPIVSKELFKTAQATLPADPTGRTFYWDLPDGTVKVSAAYLIEQAGFPRGYRDGNVGISPKHTLALINYGGGTASDIIRLAKTVCEKVYASFGITLEPEAQFVGFAENPLM